MHMNIAHKVFETIQSELKVRINYEKFRYGSIAPDINPVLMFNSHSLASSIDFIHRSMEHMTDTGLITDKLNIKKFSFNLGMVIHFISDYFCKAHNDQKYKNIIIHYLYEKRLEKFFNGIKNDCDIFGGLPRNGVWRLETSLKEYICCKHTEYCMTNRTMDHDIHFAVGVSSVVALNIVQRVLENGKNKLLKTA